MAKWEYEDDYECSKVYIKRYLIDKEFDVTDILSYNLYLKFNKKFERNSIKMKLQNIKYILETLMQIKHVSPYTGLKNYSEQNLKAVCYALTDLGLWFIKTH